MEIELGPLKNADGSALFTDTNGTRILCGVFGPDETRQRSKEIIERAHLDVVFKPIQGQTHPWHRKMEKVVRDAFEQVVLVDLHPRMQICITFQLMCDYGNVLSACLNACTLAVLHAGLPLTRPLVSTSVAILSNGEMVTCPTQQDMKTHQSFHSFAYDIQHVSKSLEDASMDEEAGADEQGRWWFQSEGMFTYQHFEEAHDTGREEAVRIWKMMRQAMDAQSSKLMQVRGIKPAS